MDILTPHKQILDQSIQIDLYDLFNDKTIEQVQYELNKYKTIFKSEFYTEIMFVCERTYSCINITMKVYRRETDDELYDRVLKEEAEKKKIQEKIKAKKKKALEKALVDESDELALYEKLKAKFGE